MLFTFHNHWEKSECIPHLDHLGLQHPGQYCEHQWTIQGILILSTHEPRS